jgi:hypothetical protein
VKDECLVLVREANQSPIQDRSEYTAWNITHNLDVLEPVSASVSLPNQLKKRGLDPDQVDTVLFRYEEMRPSIFDNEVAD